MSIHPTKVSFLPPKTIVLVGLMGCGKTSIGRRLAKRLDLPFCDSDQAVEEAAGCSLKEMYSCFGEDEFRKGEFKVIKRLLNESTCILATGGGSFVTEETRQLIQEKAISVWLKADLETLLARVSRRRLRRRPWCTVGVQPGWLIATPGVERNHGIQFSHRMTVNFQCGQRGIGAELLANLDRDFIL